MNRADKAKRPENPVVRSTVFSKIFFLFLNDIFKIGLKRKIEETDVYTPLKEHHSNEVSELFTKLWNEELKRKNSSLMRLFLRAYGLPVISWGLLFSLFETVTRVVQPLCLGGLVAYFAPEQTDITQRDAYIYAIGIILTSFLQSVVFHPFLFYIIQAAIKLRVGCCSLMYKKTLRLSKSTVYDGMNGQVINLMTNDVGKFDIGLCFVHDLWKGPLEALFLGYFIYREIGISAIIGMAFMLSFIPLQAWIGKKSATYRIQAAKRTDIRVRFMNEIIQGIQVIKMYTWERSFAKMVDKVRRKEINAIRGGAYIRAGLFSFFVISRVSIFLSLITYVIFGSIITARKVFIVSSFFTVLNLSMVFFWPLAITSCTEAYISVIRIQEFLQRREDKEMSDDYTSNNELRKPKKGDKNKNDIISNKISNGDFEYRNKNIENEEKNNIRRLGNIEEVDEISELIASNRIENVNAVEKGLIINGATAVWTHKEKKIGLFSINLNVVPQKLCAIIGAVGCGKTTLLNIVVGELGLDDGTIYVNGKLSYAAQESWLFEGSIRKNIVFIETFDEKRYREVCRVCALERDFDLLPYGDATIVGERGMVLSGGQKARVSLARAVYKQADIYLLDDPLSAVDTHVGKHIFNECVQGFLKDKCVVLATHQLQYLKHVKHIVLMDAGRIEAQGSFNEVKESKGNSILALTIHEESNVDPEKTNVDKELEHLKPLREQLDDDPEEEKEVLTEGSVRLGIYSSYFKSVKSITVVALVLLSFVLCQGLLSGVDYFVAQWVNWEESMAVQPTNTSNLTSTISSSNFSILENNFLSSNETFQEYYNDTNHINITNPFGIFFPNTFDLTVEIVREQYIIVYSVMMVLLVWIVLTRNFSFFKMGLRASIYLHDKLFRGITRAKMNFFNNNPSGRILNRFSKDIGAVDTFLPNSLIDSLDFILQMTAISAIVSMINPWLFIPTAIMGVIFYLLREIYIRTSRAINRIESLSRSPIYAHTNATIQGLSTIRAFKAAEILNQEFNHHQDNNTGALYLFYATSRAFALWLDLVCVFYIALVTLSFLTISRNDLGGNVGLVISQVVTLIGMTQWGMRQTAELENKMISVERVLEYADLPAEPPLETLPKYRPPTGWPEFGGVVFNNLSLSYSSSSEPVLRNLNFSVKPMEKVGIVGRTGAGKSSIIQALFRLAEIEGKIEIDGIDTQTLGLHDLRSKIAIIPQDPVLFSGTMRNNLDPFEEKSDDEMWSALQQVELKQAVNSLAGGLDCKMSDGGSNFSMGQRQLVCLARAILKNNKILILDEATANVDPETDKLIQTTIRNKFSDCTVLTIAHRLHTVMDNDRVLVMDAGRVVEFAHPFDLLQRSGGHLKKLVDQTGTATSNILIKIAQDNYEAKQSNNQLKISSSP